MWNSMENASFLSLFLFGHLRCSYQELYIQDYLPTSQSPPMPVCIWILMFFFRICLLRVLVYISFWCDEKLILNDQRACLISSNSRNRENRFCVKFLFHSFRRPIDVGMNTRSIIPSLRKFVCEEFFFSNYIEAHIETTTIESPLCRSTRNCQQWRIVECRNLLLLLM